MKSSFGLLMLLVSGLAVASTADALLYSFCERAAVNAVKAHVVTTGNRICFPWLGQGIPAESIGSLGSWIGEHEASRMRASSLLWGWLNQVAKIGIKGRSVAIRRDVLPMGIRHHTAMNCCRMDSRKSQNGCSFSSLNFRSASRFNFVSRTGGTVPTDALTCRFDPQWGHVRAPVITSQELQTFIMGSILSLPARTQARRRNQQLNPNKTRQT